VLEAEYQVKELLFREDLIFFGSVIFSLELEMFFSEKAESFIRDEGISWGSGRGI
jgi:hypothetical protein